jgi:hypothetical protein
MTDANAQSKVLVVPIHIAVLRSGGGNIGALGARADFSKLPYCEQEQAVQTCPFTSDLALEETKKQPTPGVHLHWTLPEAFRTLRKQPEEEGRASQPEGEEEAVTLPNRWRVTRTIHGPKGSRSQSWIIESNRLNRKDPRLNVWPATVTVPVHPDDAFATSEENTVDESYLGCEQSHRYLGQVFDAVTWTEQQEEMAVIDPGNPENNKEYLFQMLPPSLGRSVRRRYPLRSRRLTPKTELHKRTTPYDLTIVGYGDLDFTSFYPNCSSVFGFCDPADQLAVSGYDCTQDKLSYSVTGWYCEDEKDPLQKLNFSFFQSTVLQLNGNGKVECPAHGNPTEAISVSLWVKSASETWNSSSDLLCKRDAFILHPEKNSKKIQFKVSLPKGWKTVAFTPDDSFDLKQWHQYAATYDGKVLILSIDGEECARTEGAGAITNANSELSIGHDPVHGGDDGFKGLLAHVCLWQKALSAAEIQAFHERPPTSEEADLLAYFPLNQFATGSTVTNLGGKEVPHVCPDGTVINGSIVTSNSLPVTCSTKDDADAYQAYQDSGLKLGEQETGCYNSEFEWFFPSPSKVKPVASLYHGIVEAFDFDVTQVYDIPTQISQGKHDIVIGNNTAEAYSALLTVRLENTISENTLNALQSNLLPTLNKVGGAIAVDRQLHAARFRPAVEGKTWQLTGIRTDDNLDRLDKQSQANTTLPKLTSELIALVNELNEAELSIQQVELQLTGTQQQLMADWRKFLYFQYTKSFPVGSPPYHWLNEQNTQGSGDPRAPILNYLDSVLYGFEVEIVRLRQVQNDQANKISRLQRAIRSILEETDAVLQTPRGVVFRGKLSAYYELTPGSTIPATYYQANEPCVLLAGPGLETPINYQHCPDRRDGFLECDVDLPNNLPASSPFLPDRFAAVSAATFAGRQAGAVLASTLQALEKRACLVANNDRSFTVPSPKITVTKKGEIENCWLPLMLAWEAKVRPLKVATLPQNELHYEADTLLTRFNWNDEVMDLKENKDLLNKQKQTLVVKNRLQLSAGVTASLQDQINILLEKLDDPQSQDAIALKDLKSKLSQTKLMSQVMAGFSQGLLMRAQTMQLAVWDPVAGTTTDWDRVVKMQDAIGDQNSLGEVSSGSFSPLRGGIMQLAIQVIDCFGRNLLLQQSDEHGSPQSGFIVAQSLTPADLDVALTRYINLPPRLVAPAHLHFNWICAQSLKRYINSHDVNPILGWILYNYLENSLDIYDAKGKTIGSIFVVERDGRLVLLSQGQPGSTNWPDLAPINNKILAAVVDMLSRQTPAYLHAFFTMLNDATQLTPSEVNNATNVSVLLGKPLALVSAYLKLECNGHAFPLSQGWMELKAAATTSPPLNMLAARNAQALHEVQFPMRLGHENSVDDGLIGFFKHMPNREIDTARFYSQSASDAEVASTATIVQPKIDDLVLSIDPQHCELVTLLIDPFKPVHLTSGVLPIQSLTVSKEHLDAALENMKSTFLLTPVICPPGFIDLPSPTEVVRKLPMPTPSVSLSNGQWSWLQPEGRSADASLTWDTYEPTNSSCEVGVNFSPQTIHEGWLVLSHSRQTLVLEDQPTPSDQMLLPEPVLPPEVFPEVNAGDEPPLETRF